MMKLFCSKKRRLPFRSGGPVLAALVLAVPALAGLAVSCDQDPIFAMIAREVKPREPRIKGVPTKMVLWNGTMYVGGNSLHNYRAGAWDTNGVPPPPGKIIDLAATTSYLYALVNADSPALYRLIGSSWNRVNFPGGNYLQTIYGATGSDGTPVSDCLFVGARQGPLQQDDSKNYAVFYINGSANPASAVTGTGLLTGAAFDDTTLGSECYYFSTKGGGIYLRTGPAPAAFSPLSAPSKDVTGLVRINDTSPFQILALCYSGDILAVTSASKLNNNNTGFNLPGPATVWTSPGGSQLLLVSVLTKDTLSPAYGYREIVISSGSINAGNISFREPGNGTPGAPSSMDDPNRYKDTIEPKPVNAIFQAPDGTLFASVQGRGTSKDGADGGLWSLRIRDNVLQWNAEE
jgi:hypothetical protein